MCTAFQVMLTSTADAANAAGILTPQEQPGILSFHTLLANASQTMASINGRLAAQAAAETAAAAATAAATAASTSAWTA